MSRIEIDKTKRYVIVASTYQCAKLWANRYHLSMHMQGFRFTTCQDPWSVRGINPATTIVVEVCMYQWSHSRLTRDVLVALAMHEDMGGKVLMDVCTDSAPDLNERWANWNEGRGGRCDG